MSSPPPTKAALNKLKSPSDTLLSPVSRMLKRKRIAQPPKPLRVILGSGSVGRRAVLSRRGLPFATATADIDEKIVAGRKGATPGDLALAVASAKADAIMPTLPSPCLLITADQIVLGPDGVPREKPSSPEEARAFLASYAGAASRTVSAVVVTNTATGAVAKGVAVETIRYSSGLSELANLEAALQPAAPVDSRALLADLRGALAGAGAASASSSSAASSSASTLFSSPAPAGAAAASSTGGGAGASSSSRRKSLRLSGAGLPEAASDGAGEPATVSVLATAGAVMIEHPANARHISAVERGDTTGAGSTVSAAHAAPAGPADDVNDTVDSIYGLPWRLTQRLVAQVAPGHPWAAPSL